MTLVPEVIVLRCKTAIPYLFHVKSRPQSDPVDCTFIRAKFNNLIPPQDWVGQGVIEAPELRTLSGTETT